MPTKQPNDKDVKKILGLPMRWQPRNMFKNIWNKDDDRVFPPKYYGIGWNLNFHALCKKLGVISKGGNKK